MMIKKFAGAAALLFALSIPAFAQQPAQPPKAPPGPQAMRPRMLSPEIALRMKEQLKLTDAQASQLEALRKEIVAERQERATAMIDIQSRLAAGIIKREDVRKQFDDKREAMRQAHEQRQERLAKILTEDQQQQLQRAERRALMQRARMRGGFGGRGGFAPMGPMRPMRPMHPMRPMRPMPPGGPGFGDEE